MEVLNETILELRFCVYKLIKIEAKLELLEDFNKGPESIIHVIHCYYERLYVPR